MLPWSNSFAPAFSDSCRKPQSLRRVKLFQSPADPSEPPLENWPPARSCLLVICASALTARPVRPPNYLGSEFVFLCFTDRKLVLL